MTDATAGTDGRIRVRGSALARIARIQAIEQRWRTLGWAVMFGAFCTAVVRGFHTAYPTEAARLDFAQLVEAHAGFRLLNGLPYRIDTLGGFVPWRLSVLTVFAAAWALLTTTRMLRGEEDAGRWEILVAGRRTTRALCLALLGTAWLGLLVIGVSVVVVVTMLGLPLTGTILFAASLLGPAAGWIGIAGIASQLYSTRRAAATACAVLLGLALLMRVVADALELDWLRWLTPFGWYDLVRPYSQANVAPLLLFAALAVTTTIVTLALVTRRDVGGSLLEQHDPRPSRLMLLGAPWQLELRAMLRPIASWIVGLWGFAALLGLLVQDIAAVAERSSGIRELFSQLVVGKVVLDQYLSIVLVFVCLVASIHAITHIAAMRQEEASGRLDVLLALPMTRDRWLAGWVAVTLASSAVLLVGAAAAIWLAASLRETPVPGRDLLVAGASWTCAVAAFHGIGIGLLGWFPRRAGGVAGAVVLASFTWWAVASVMDVPGWTRRLSAFDQLAHIPSEQFEATPAIVVLMVAMLGYALGWAGLRRRDVQPD